VKSDIDVITTIVITTMSNLTLATPLRQTFRGPLAKQIEAQLSQRAELVQDQLLDMATVKVALGISQSTLAKLVKNKELSVIRIGKHGHRKCRASELRRFLQQAVVNGA
jgi:hypothetical protein